MSTAAERLIVALDCTSAREALAMARRLRVTVRMVKIGSVLFTAAGPELIRRLRALGFGVMLDLKWYDIPSTVELACRAAVHHRVRLVTVHAAGGRAMLEAAVRGASSEARRKRVPRPRILAVTILTSVGSRASRSISRRVAALAGHAARAGCDGVVASAHEVRALRRRFGDRLHIVCPGIRPAAATQHDQRRVATPAHALALGADALVIGRPITAARDPRAAAEAILHEMECAHAC